MVDCACGAGRCASMSLFLAPKPIPGGQAGRAFANFRGVTETRPGVYSYVTCRCIWGLVIGDVRASGEREIRSRGKDVDVDVGRGERQGRGDAMIGAPGGAA